MDPGLLQRCTEFYSTVCEFMLYQFEGRPIEGPFISKLPVQQLLPTDAFSALPEWYIDDIAEFILFTMQHANMDIRQGIDHSIITWLLTCVCASHLIKNPYVTAKLVEVMFVFSLKPANSVNAAVGSGYNRLSVILLKLCLCAPNRCGTMSWPRTPWSAH